MEDADEGTTGAWAELMIRSWIEYSYRKIANCASFVSAVALDFRYAIRHVLE